MICLPSFFVFAVKVIDAVTYKLAKEILMLLITMLAKEAKAILATTTCSAWCIAHSVVR